jgi:metalloendopeptidase OMA1, mitochondrial
MPSKAERSYPKRRPGALLLLLLPLLFAVGGCQTTPVTGKKTINLFTPEQDVELGREAYQEVLKGQRLITSGPDYERVKHVMERLVAVADDQGYEWEVSLIDDPKTANAFALPGGKMAVYSGILPVCKTEAGLAVVMGHEIGHVVAQHGTQRMSRSMGAEALLTLADLGKWEDLATAGYGFLVDMPFGRGEELEADHIGVIYMARAGYDPHESMEFWSRMAGGGGGEPPEFLSTHPSHSTRIADLEALMPKAMKEYEASSYR